MPHHVFFSWQTDTPNKTGRTLIENCLKEAIARLKADADLDLPERELKFDKDTMDVGGSPAIVETIYGKIDRAAIFVSDLTYVANRDNGDGIPNPNVSIEHGRAIKALGPGRVISIMNTAFGHLKDQPLPFDLRHVRWPYQYVCRENETPASRSQVSEAMTAHFEMALRTILSDEDVLSALKPPASADPHPHDVGLLAKIHRQFPLRLRQFIRTHNFCTPFPFAELKLILEMNEDWVGAAYEFHDPVLQASFADVLAAASQFGSLVGKRIYALENNPKMGSPKTDMDVTHGIQPGTAKAIDEMNDRAACLSAAIDSFDRVARDRIRIAPGLHDSAAVARESDKEAEQKAFAGLNQMAADVVRFSAPEIVTPPFLTLRLAPFKAAEEFRLDRKKIADVRLRFPPSTLEKVKSEADGAQWWSCALPRQRPGRHNPETTWCMRLVRPGYLEYRLTIGQRKDDDAEILVDGRRLEAQIVRNLERMATLAIELGLSGKALISISLDGMEDVRLTSVRAGGRVLKRADVRLSPARIDGLDIPIAADLQEQFDILWETSGWPDGSPSFDSDVWAGYTDARNYDLD